VLSVFVVTVVGFIASEKVTEILLSTSAEAFSTGDVDETVGGVVSGVPNTKDPPSSDAHEKSKNEDIFKININFKRFSHF
jgi:hypothetical protein